MIRWVVTFGGLLEPRWGVALWGGLFMLGLIGQTLSPHRYPCEACPECFETRLERSEHWRKAHRR